MFNVKRAIFQLYSGRKNGMHTDKYKLSARVAVKSMQVLCYIYQSKRNIKLLKLQKNTLNINFRFCFVLFFQNKIESQHLIVNPNLM